MPPCWRVIFGKDLRVASVNKKLTIHKELNLPQNHVNLEADPYPVEFSDEASTLADNLPLVRDSEAKSPDKASPNYYPIDILKVF